MNRKMTFLFLLSDQSIGRSDYPWLRTTLDLTFSAISHPSIDNISTKQGWIIKQAFQAPGMGPKSQGAPRPEPLFEMTIKIISCWTVKGLSQNTGSFLSPLAKIV